MPRMWFLEAFSYLLHTELSWATNGIETHFRHHHARRAGLTMRKKLEAKLVQ